MPSHEQAYRNHLVDGYRSTPVYAPFRLKSRSVMPTPPNDCLSGGAAPEMVAHIKGVCH